MRLKKMELYGFKSFARKTVIEFGQGITAVVGPNGSGKSNVADAVRWALGEQSAKQLRGSKMEDVIFNGSRNKKGLGLAEVSLFFDNTDGLLAVDYNEVVITRRMYRSGESEYKLNNNLCRLKDIHELFMGTGIGKETYATIEQGKIDNLTSTRAEERRQVFEEAAGILKHKYKKKEALSKLGDVEQKILRLEDILKEIKQQLLPLQQQKEKAECFREYSSVLEEAERKTALNKWRILQEEKQRLNALKLENQTKHELLAGELAELAVSLTAEEQKIKQNEELLTANLLKQQEIEGKAAFCRERIESTAGQLRELQEREKNSQQKKEQLLTALAGEEKEKLAYHKELAELERKLSICGDELTLLGGRVAEQEGAVQKKVQAIEDLKGDLIELLNEKAKRQYELQRLAGQEKEHIKRLEQLEEKEQRLKADCGKAADKIIELKEKQEKLMTDQAAGLQKEHSLKAEITLLQEKLLERQKAWQEQESRLNQAKSRQKVLAELEQSLEGYYKGTKSILKSNLKERFLGTVAQLITVEKRYETAIEIALGGSLQNIITPTEKDAQSLIAYLKKTNGGRATFLPLDRVHGEKKQIGQMKGLIGVAADLLRFAPQYEGVINQLLGRILISDNLANASEIALNTGQRYKIITLDGDVISPGGAMTGGSFAAKQNGLLSRKRELEDLNFTITGLEEQQGKERRAISGLKKQEEERKAEQGKIHEELLRLDFALKQLKQELSEAEVGKEQLVKEQEGLQWQNRQAEEAGESRKQEELREEARLAEIRQTEDSKRDLIKHYQEEETGLRQELEKINEEFMNLKLEVNSGEKDRLHLLSLISRLEKTIADRQQELALCSRNKEEEKHKIEALNRIISEGEQETELLAREKQKNIAVKAALEKEKAELYDELHSLKQTLAEKNKIREKYAKSLLCLASQQAKQEERMKQQEVWLTENCSEPYPCVSLTAEEEAELGQRTALYRRKISELGTVNLGAVEEFNKLQERYSFLDVQYTDLKDARSSLDTLLLELDEIMEKNFLAAFDAIKEAFAKTFQQLFGGGSAQLFLSEPQAVLTSGVEVMVQPPGKKLQSLSLLSGGEKALTAVALLLAILEVRPSPFCLLDEADAALDDKNVQRVAELLKEMAETVQFIMITHRKGAMEIADALYGITMEDGVSSLLSVKLENYEGEKDYVQ